MPGERHKGDPVTGGVASQYHLRHLSLM